MLKFNRNSTYLPYVPSHIIGLYQEGGELKMSEEAMQEEPTEDPMMEVLTMAQQAVENNDSEIALQVCQMLVDMMMQQQEKPEQEEEPIEE